MSSALSGGTCCISQCCLPSESGILERTRRTEEALRPVQTPTNPKPPKDDVQYAALADTLAPPMMRYGQPLFSPVAPKPRYTTKAARMAAERRDPLGFEEL